MKGNFFKEVKELLKPTQVVSLYLGKGNKKGDSYWYVSPFREEKTASFCVNDKKGIHDFGDSSHYDIISFTKKYFSISNYKAIQKLIVDFNLPIEFNFDKPLIYMQRDFALYNEKIKDKKMMEKNMSDFHEFIYEVACERFKFWHNLRLELQCERKNLTSINLANIYKNEQFSEWLCDEIFKKDDKHIWENSDTFCNMII